MSLAATLPMSIVVVGAFLAITRSNILHAVFGLAISLVGVAGIFFALHSPFVAVMEILIYVGGITVTMIFAVMLSSVANTVERQGILRHALAALVSALFFAGGAVIVLQSDWNAGQELPEHAWSLQAVGADLLNRYNLAFETLSVVLLLAIVGAIVIVRKEPTLPAAEIEATPKEETTR